MERWRVLITGASGLLGRAIHKAFQSSEHWEVLGLAFSRLTTGLKKVDLNNAEETRKVINEFRPDVIIHAAAERRPDKVSGDVESARSLNVGSTETIAKIVADMNDDSTPRGKHFLLYISTDYVFDGKLPPFKPDDTPYPLNEYGKQKLEGEKVVLKYNPKAGILRVPVLYGESSDVKESAVTVLYEIVKSSQPTSIDNFQVRYPTLTDDVSRIIMLICEERMSNDSSFHGIWHWSGPTNTTKYKIAKIIAETCGIPHQHITPMDKSLPGAAVSRPQNSALDSSFLEQKFKNKATKTTFEVGIKQILLNMKLNI